MDTATESPLATMTRTTPTQYWNDSCSVAELEYAVANGAVGDVESDDRRRGPQERA